jgi:hypothetical protein
MADARASGTIIARDILLRVADTADRYALHAALDQRFGRRGSSGYLWSPGMVADGAAVRVRLPPDHAESEAGIAIHGAGSGDRLGFRLRANVTRKFGPQGRRVSLPRDAIDARRAWLERRAAEHGFSVDRVELTVDRIFIRKGRGFWIDETIFSGSLVVVDAARFAAALVGGVGQRGSFGFGLLETF